MNENILQIIEQFDIKDHVMAIIPWGNGLINDTFRVNTDGEEDYLLQHISKNAYSDIDGIMHNIYLVTETIRQQSFYLRNGKKKQELRLILLKNGDLYYRQEDGSGWRMYNFFKNSYSMERAEDSFEMYKSGILLGQFHYLLRDFPVEKLSVTHPHFHDPAYRYQELLEAAKKNICGRLSEVSEELDFFKSQKAEYNYFNQRLQEGALPLRVNHNDPKVNNIMFDTENVEPLCLVDLDTLMPGVIPYDFGDAIRSAMCTGKDTGADTDLSATLLNLEIYEEYLKGFLEGCQGILTPNEQADLPVGAKMIAIENAMRYLTDYLNGDTYFKIKYPEQNLIKCRMHIQLYKYIKKRL